MSQNFTARRAPNVSQYLQGLNEMPHPGQTLQNDFALEEYDNLANVDFFDLDAATFNAPAFPQESQDPRAKNGAQYQFNEFQAYPHTNANSPSSAMPSPPALHGNYPPQSGPFSHSPVTGDKRKASLAMAPSAADLEEQSRLAAEEDKRRRNTAASARFRIKKKQREQALEKQTKEMSDKVALLEGKVQQLEMENKWLKELITEKSDVKTLDFAQMKREKESEERSTGNRTDGVGTQPEDVDAEVDIEA